MEISPKDLWIFAFALGGASVLALGFGLRVIVMARSHEPKERLELIIVGLTEIIFCGGFFVWQFIKIIERF